MGISPKTPPPVPGLKIYCQRVNISSHCGHGTFMPKSFGAFCDYYRRRSVVAGCCQRQALCPIRPDLVWTIAAILASKRSDHRALYRPVRPDTRTWMFALFMASSYCIHPAMASSIMFFSFCGGLKSVGQIIPARLSQTAQFKPRFFLRCGPIRRAKYAG